MDIKRTQYWILEIIMLFSMLIELILLNDEQSYIVRLLILIIMLMGLWTLITMQQYQEI